MKNKLFKVLSSALILSVTLSIITACGSSSSTPTSTSTSTTSSTTTTVATADESAQKAPALSGNLKIFFPGDASVGEKGVADAIAAKMKADGLNLTLEYTYTPWDNYWNKQALVVAAGDEYDLTWDHKEQISGHVSKGIVAPLDDALKTNGQAIISCVPDYAFKEVTYNGKIYAMPRNVPSAIGNIIAIRGDWREKYGIAPIKTVADLEKYFDAVLKDGKLVNAQASPLDSEICPGLRTPIGSNGLNALAVNINTLKVVNWFETPEFKAYMDKANEWQKKGYFPKDVQKIDDSYALFLGGKSATMAVNIMRPTEIIDAFKQQNPDGKLELVVLNPEQPRYIHGAVDNLLAVFSTSKKITESVAFVNWFLSSQENYDLFTFGVKDVNYKLDGNSVQTVGIAKENQYAPISWAWTNMKYNRFSKNLSEDYLNTLTNWDKTAIQSPIIGITYNLDSVKADFTKVQAAMAEYQQIIGFGLVAYDKFAPAAKAKMKAAGIDNVIAEMQKQIDAFKK